MNKIYTDKIPETCNDCKLGYFFDTQYCFIRPDLIREGIDLEKEKHCQLLSLQEHDKKVRQEICEKIYKVFTNGRMWSTMKDWWLNNGQCKELKEVLNAVEQGFSNQEIVENFSKDKEYYHLLKKFKEENNE